MSFLRQILVFLVTFLFLSAHTGFGQEPFLLVNKNVPIRMDTHLEVFLDPTDNTTFEEISKPTFQGFKPSESNLTFGYMKHTLWLKLKTKSAHPQTNWYLEIPAPFLEYVDFYQWDDHQKKWDHSLAGYYRPQSDRKVSHTSHVIPLVFSADSTSTVFVKIGGISPKTFPVNIIEKERFYELVRQADVGYGIFFGILIVMFFFNLFIYFTLKQTNYLLYICTIICTFLIFSSATGYAGKFFWPESPAFNFFAGRLSLGVLAIVLSIFTIRFLEVKRYSKVMYYVLLSLIPLAIISMILVATKLVSSAGNNLISVSTILFMATGIVCTAKGNKTGYYFIAAWTIYFVGGLLLTLRNSGFFDYNFWTTHFVEIGAILETVIIAFALADRYRRLRIEKEQAQRLALELQREVNEQLELKVAERTEQLSKANLELQGMLETNQIQTRMIEDKNAELDSFFYRISHDLKGPIASLLGLGAVAKREVTDPNALEFLNKKQTQVERLDNIITGLINLTQLNQGELRHEKIDFDKLVDDCITSLNGHDNFNKLTFKKEIHPEVEFYSEWTLLNGILQNLIENAIKYSGPKSPYVLIKIFQVAGDIVIKVQDNGRGIPPEHHAKIFDMFYRATEYARGTGLGLYILKRCVNKLRGTIEIESEVGIGSTFTVRLPID